MVNPGDGTATRADRGNVNSGTHDRPPGYVGLGALDDIAMVNQGDVDGRPAYIKTDKIFDPELSGQGLGSDNATRRTGFKCCNRSVGGPAGGHNAAVGLHHRKRRCIAVRFQPLRHVVDVVCKLRLYVSVEHRGRRPFEFTPFTDQFMGSRDGNSRVSFPDPFCCQPFMCRVGITVQKADSYGLTTMPGQQTGFPVDGIQVQGNHFLTAGAQAARYFPAQVTGNQAAGRAVMGIVNFRARTPAYLQYVPETGSGEQTYLYALLLDDRVHHNRSAVKDTPDLGKPDGQAADSRADLLDNPFRRRRLFLQRDLARGLVKQDEINEGASHVDGDPVAGS